LGQTEFSAWAISVRPTCVNSRRPHVGLNPAGTAFDIAGRGIADEMSMVEAIKLAAKMAEVKMTSKR
jgi:hypothetical protein